MKIESAMLRAAQVCQAKNDPRGYLKGIHIKGDKIEATNGHVAVQLTMDKKVRGEFILDIKGKVPVKAKMSKLEFAKDSSLVKHYDHLGELLSIQPVKVRGGNYPNFEKVIPKEFNDTGRFGVNASYLAMAEKMFGRGQALKIRFSGDVIVIEPVGIKAYGLGEPMLVIKELKISE